MSKKVNKEKKREEFINRNGQFVIVVLIILLFLAAGINQLIINTEILPRESPEKSEIEIKEDLFILEEVAKEHELPEETPTNDPTFTYENTTAYEGALFFEELTKINGENVYIAHPKVIDTENPPVIVIYSHGSITTISDSMDDPFMSGLIREYAELLTANNFVFAASNQHGANWGSAESVEDTKLLIEYIKEKYQTSKVINMIAFSMGGLPTWEFITLHPKDVKNVALLAPTTYYWNHPQEEIFALRDMNIKIWHGDIDQSVPLSMSQNMVNHAKKYDQEIELVVLNGKDHWSIDTEYKEEILQFFQDNK